jgi:hypothetical protein
MRLQTPACASIKRYATLLTFSVLPCSYFQVHGGSSGDSPNHAPGGRSPPSDCKLEINLEAASRTVFTPHLDRRRTRLRRAVRVNIGSRRRGGEKAGSYFAKELALQRLLHLLQHDPTSS